MGYFDALTESSFRTTQDGHRLFFPWGPWGRGYVVPSEKQYQRLHQKLKAFMMAALIPVIGLAIMTRYGTAVVMGVIVMALYPAWILHLVHGLPPSEDRLPVPKLREHVAAQARANSLASLWFMLVASSLFFVVGAFMIWTPGNRLWGILCILLFGPGVPFATTMLVLRRRPAQGARQLKSGS
jgi:hypothetical protein